MALIRFAEGQQRSGSVGGTVFSHNRFGAYIRARSVPVNPNTDRQVVVRNATRSLTIAWNNTLTEAQRLAWDTYGAAVPWTNKFGDVVTLPGLNHYVRSNVPRLQSGFARIDAAPVLFTLAAAELGLVVTASEGTQLASVVFDDTQAWCSEDDAHQFVFAGIPQNTGIKFFGGPYRLAGTIDGDSVTPPTSPQTFTWPWPIAADQRLWTRTRIGRADGRLSEFAQMNFLCAV